MLIISLPDYMKTASKQVASETKDSALLPEIFFPSVPSFPFQLFENDSISDKGNFFILKSCFLFTRLVSNRWHDDPTEYSHQIKLHTGWRTLMFKVMNTWKKYFTEPQSDSDYSHPARY